MLFQIHFAFSTLCLVAATADNGYRFPTRRQTSTIFLPRCKFDEHTIKSDEKLNARIATASFVFTGKVTSDLRYLNSTTVLFSVYVKRYFKNNGELKNDQEVQVLKTLYEGEGVKCRQVLRPKYTAIFIGRRPQDFQEADVHLTISPVPVTLTNLDRVSAATKGEAKHHFSEIGPSSQQHANACLHHLKFSCGDDKSASGSANDEYLDFTYMGRPPQETKKKRQSSRC